MKKNIKKYLLPLASVSGIAAFAISASCGSKDSNGGGNSETPFDPEEKQQYAWMLTHIKDDAKKTEYQTKFDAIATEEQLNDFESELSTYFDGAYSEGYLTRIKNSDSTVVNGNASLSFAQTKREHIVIGASWSNSNDQSKAIHEIVEIYNKEVEKMQAIQKDTSKSLEEKQAAIAALQISPLAKKVVINQAGSSYDTAAEKVEQSLSAKETNQFYNIIINYPTVAAKLAGANMLLSFNSKNPDTNVDLSLFDPNFTKINEQTENVDNKSSYILPTFKSTNVLSINTSVLGYILKTMKDKGVKFEEGESTTYFESIITAGKADESGVKKIWGEPVANADTVLASLKSKPLSKNIFDSYKDLVEFSIVAQKLFVNSSADNTPLHVFGIDDMAGVYEQALFAALSADEKKMIQVVSTNENGKVTVSFKTLANTGSPAYIKTEEIFTEFSKAFEANAVYAFPGGQYSSTDQTKHKMAFSIGSTAGYTHNFKKNAVSLIENTSLKFSQEYTNKNIYTFDITSIKADVKERSKDSAVAYLTGSTKYVNPVHKSTTPDAQVQPYEYKTTSTDADTKLKKLFDENKKSASIVVPLKVKENQAFYDQLKTKTNLTTLEYFPLKNNKNDDFLLVVLKDVLSEAKDKEQVQAEKYDETKLNAALAEAGLTFTKLTDADILNESELFAKVTPLKWEAKDPKKVLYVQGPSLMGIKANEEDDDATRAFVKWLLTYNKEVDFIKNSKTKETEKSIPLTFLQKKTSYVLPTKSVTSLDDKFFGKNKYLEVILQEIKKISKESDYTTFEEPAAQNSKSFREKIKAAWDAKQGQYANKLKDNITINQFVEKILQGEK